MTCAQIELMQCDLPHTLYDFNKSGDNPKKNTVASEEVLRLQEEANRKMAERKAARERGEVPYELEELYK